MVDRADRNLPDSVPATLELDHVFEALAHPRRRYLLYTLLDDAEWSLEEVSRKLAAWEEGVPVETLTDQEVERVYVSLYHNHVPKLVAEDIVEFVEATETIRPSGNAEQVLNVLENAGGSGDADQEAHARRGSDEGRT